MSGRNYAELFERFRQLRVLVIGDVMVDAYIFGKVDRISPEAPVPVVSVEKRISRLGGAANVALNLKSLGAEPVLCAVIGDDVKGKEFLQLLDQAGISSEGILAGKSRVTTTKFRVIGNNTQMLRVDEEVTGDIEPSDENKLVETIEGIIRNTSIHAVIFQDYNKGILTAGLISRVCGIANAHGIPVAVDPKKKNFFQYKNVSLFKPNLKELKEGINQDIQSGNIESLARAAFSLHETLGVKIILTTLSEHGVFISHKDQGQPAKYHTLPAYIRQVADVSGAGDTVISVAALGLVSGLEPVEIAALSNLAGGLVCEEVGVVPVNRDKLLSEATRLLNHPIV